MGNKLNPNSDECVNRSLQRAYRHHVRRVNFGLRVHSRLARRSETMALLSAALLAAISTYAEELERLERQIPVSEWVTG